MIEIIVKLKNRITKKLQMRGKHMHSFVLNWKKKERQDISASVRSFF